MAMKRKLSALECKKVWKDHRFWMLLLFLLVLHCFLLYRNEMRKNGYPPSVYCALYVQLSEMRPEEAALYVERRGEMLQYLQYAPFEEGLKRPVWNSSWPDRLYTEEVWTDMGLFDCVGKEVGAVVERDRQIAEILETTEKLGTIGLFQAKEDGYTRKNREKTAADFSTAKSIPVTELQPEQGIRLAMENGVGDAFVLLLIFFVADLMVFQGYENGLETVIAASKHGRRDVMFSRGAALFFCAGLIWGAVFGSSLFCGACWYSLGDLGRPVQLLSDYVTCLWDLSVGGLLVLTFLGKWLVFGATGLFLLCVMRLRRGILMPSGAVFALFWVEYFLWKGIADSSLYRLLRYLNLYYLLRPDMAFGIYRNLNLLGQPVSGWVIWSVAAAGLAMGSGIFLIAVRKVLPKKAQRGKLVSVSMAVRKRMAGQRKGRPHSWAKHLLAAEFYKAWRMQGIFLLFAVVLTFQIWNYSGKELFLGISERLYQNYLMKWQREIDGRDEELRELIREEEKEVQEALRQAGASQAAELRYEAFSRAQARFYELQRVAGVRTAHPWLIYDGAYKLLVDDPEQDAATGCLAFLLLLITAVRMTGYEHQSGMRVMLRTMSRAGGRYFLDKILVLGSVCLVILLIVYMPDFWLIGKTWGWDAISVPVYSLPAYGGFPLTVSIGGYLGLLFAGRFFILLLTGSVILIGMEFLRNEITGILTMGVIFGLPYLLYYISGAAYGQWGLLTWLGLNGILQG